MQPESDSLSLCCDHSRTFLVTVRSIETINRLAIREKPPPLARQPGSLSLCFAIYGDPSRTSLVTVRSNDSIHHLKEVIREKLSESVSVMQIRLWKVDPPIRLTFDTSHDKKIFVDKVQRMQLNPDSDNPPGAIQLSYPGRTVSAYWENHPAPESLHVVVQLVLTVLPFLERPLKRRKIDGGSLNPMQNLWNETWNRQADSIPWFILKETVRDQSSTEDVPPYCWVLSPPADIAHTLGLEPPTILFRDDYLRVFSKLFASSGLGESNPKLDCHPGAKFPDFFSGFHVPKQTLRCAFVLTGHRGIGKSLWLKILLILRLSARLPTFYATTSSQIFFFSKSGPVEIASDSSCLPFDQLDESYKTAWALFDSTQSLVQPPQCFMESRVFIVQTPSPRLECLVWREKKPPTTLCCLDVWSTAELICAAPLQNYHHKEKALVDFGKKYGYSARDVYGYASTTGEYEHDLREYCNKLSYDRTASIISKVQTLHFPDNVWHKIICIIPTEDIRGFTFDFASEHAYHCVLESLRKSQTDAAAKLYRLFLDFSSREMKAPPCFMLEPAAHDILRDGGFFDIIRLKHSQTARLNTHQWKTPRILSDEVWTRLHITSSGITVSEDRGSPLGQRPPMFEFGKEGGQLDRFGFYYYCPSSKSQAMFDYLVYDPKDKHAWVFQVTPLPSHTVKEKGIKELLDRGVEKFSYIAVTSDAPATIDLSFSDYLNRIVTAKYQLRLH